MLNKEALILIINRRGGPPDCPYCVTADGNVIAWAKSKALAAYLAHELETLHPRIEQRAASGGASDLDHDAELDTELVEWLGQICA